MSCPECEAKQAQIDRLMLEYCPNEMTKEQVEEWEKNQRPEDLVDRTGFTHIDNWIDSPRCTDDGVNYAKFVFWYFRYPAWAQMAFWDFMKQFKLFCNYEGKRYRVTGASRMGDVWLTKDFERETGYELRVDVAKCSNWGREP